MSQSSDSLFRQKSRDDRKVDRSCHLLRAVFGQEASIRQWECVDAKGRVIPWYPYPAIDFLDQFRFEGVRVFEWGSGHSTLWWLSKGALVTAIENNFTWYNRTRKKLTGSETLDYHLVETRQHYVARPEVDQADIIVIDGMYRAECVAYLCHKWPVLQQSLKLVIFDNSDWYPCNITRLANVTRWPQTDFMGFGPIKDYCWAASFFHNPDSPFERQKPILPTGGKRVRKEEDYLVNWPVSSFCDSGMTK